MNKAQLNSAVSAALSVKASEADRTVATLMDVFKTALLSGEEVTLPGIGKLKVSTRPGRNGRNPSTGAAIVIPAKRVVKFSPASTFNDEVKVVPETK